MDDVQTKIMGYKAVPFDPSLNYKAMPGTFFKRSPTKTNLNSTLGCFELLHLSNGTSYLCDNLRAFHIS